MTRILHITNGDSVSLDATGLGGKVLAWQDVLHEGPVPAGLTLDQMRSVRARFLANLTGRPEPEVLVALNERDRTLGGFKRANELVLWFEHDLYDQLQLIQILDWLSREEPGRTAISLIQTSSYLGPMVPQELVDLYPKRVFVTEAHFETASRAWAAFCSSNPRTLVDLALKESPALPYLPGALQRHVEQFPSTENGLSRTERQILEIAEGAAQSADAIFRSEREREERIFMGDLVFNAYLRALASGPVPLLRIADPHAHSGKSLIEVTLAGRAVLHGEADHVELNGIDRWLGGVHLHRNEVWRWSSSSHDFVN
jgi:hypothetical protein